MHRTAIKKRLAALEQRHEQPPTPCLFLIRDIDGSVSRDGIRYENLDAALEVLKPADYVVAEVLDCSLSTRIKDNASQG